MAFGYLRDPLFLACFAAYWLHRLVAGCGMSTPLLRSYLNDLICLPFWVPIMLWAERKLRLRSHDDPPYAQEIVIPLLVLAVVLEVVLPATPVWSGLATPDPNDVLCYAADGLIAHCYWRWRYRGGGKPINKSSLPTAPNERFQA